MWAGIAMMSLVAGALLYFGWWTKAALSIIVGMSMVGVASALPSHGSLILGGGLAVFALVASWSSTPTTKANSIRTTTVSPTSSSAEANAPVKSTSPSTLAYLRARLARSSSSVSLSFGESWGASLTSSVFRARGLIGGCGREPCHDQPDRDPPNRRYSWPGRCIHTSAVGQYHPPAR